MATEAVVFHPPIHNVGVKTAEGEPGALLGDVLFHKDGEFVGGVGCCIHRNRVRVYCI